MSEPWQNEKTLRKMYWEKEMSCAEIAEKLGCTTTTVTNWFDRFNIQKRSHKEATQLTNRVERALFRTDTQGRERVECQTNHECVKVHRLIAASMFGAENVGDKFVHHKNGIPWDNRPDNLELVTHIEHNKIHHERGDYNLDRNRSVSEKLNNEETMQAVNFKRMGYTYNEISETYDVSKSHIHHIINEELGVEV